ncbi:hypothetical protein BLX88_08060 [Bacillus obstructivus]|nr:hypothetical protein BLX88_08060 [Bacillus obstructivus]
MNNEHIEHFKVTIAEPFLLIPFILLFFLYLIACIVSNRHYKRWSYFRIFYWGLGVLCMATVAVGPLAKSVHSNFTAHMFGHLLLGMLSPLLILLSAPMTLFLRILRVKHARYITKVLKSFPIRLICDPLTASLLNVGGLWLLYTTNLFSQMHQNILLYLFIHLHVFIAGYVYTAAFIYIDPIPHRTSYMYRAIIMIISMASHGVLSKYIYAHPPNGVTTTQAEIGGMIMYYGGDLVDIILIYIFCLQWYKSAKIKSNLVKQVNI